MSSPAPRMLLLGTLLLAQPTAEMLRTAYHDALMGVVTQPDARAGRAKQPSPPPLAHWAQEHDVRTWQPRTKAQLAACIKELQPDVCIVVAYGVIIPEEILALPRYGFLNVHPSLLPRWRGPSPIATAIAAGDTETGVTIIQLDAKMDHGPILAQERLSVPEDAARTTLEAALATLGAVLLQRVLPEYLAGRVTPQPQNDAHATYCKLLTREDGRMDWKEPAAILERKVRAYEGWPGTWCIIGSTRCKILVAKMGEVAQDAPGIITRDSQGRMSIACGDARTLIMLRVQPEGKPPMSGEDFLHGYRGSMVTT